MRIFSRMPGSVRQGLPRPGGEMKRSRISEPSTWGGLAAMCIGLMPMFPAEHQPAIAVVAVVFGAVGVIMREKS